MQYIKKASKTSSTGEQDVRATVQSMLDEIETGGEDVCRSYAEKLDQWSGNIVIEPDERAASHSTVNQRLKDDIRFARDNVRRFAEAQLATIGDTELEIIPGLIAGQKQIPVSAAGCYAPGVVTLM